MHLSRKCVYSVDFCIFNQIWMKYSEYHHRNLSRWGKYCSMRDREVVLSLEDWKIATELMWAVSCHICSDICILLSGFPFKAYMIVIWFCVRVKQCRNYRGAPTARAPSNWGFAPILQAACSGLEELGSKQPRLDSERMLCSREEAGHWRKNTLLRSWSLQGAAAEQSVPSSAIWVASLQTAVKKEHLSSGRNAHHWQGRKKSGKTRSSPSLPDSQVQAHLCH